MGIENEVAPVILEKEVDYVLAVKDNQLSMNAEVERVFEAEVESGIQKK